MGLANIHLALRIYSSVLWRLVQLRVEKRVVYFLLFDNNPCVSGHLAFLPQMHVIRNYVMLKY